MAQLSLKKQKKLMVKWIIALSAVLAVMVCIILLLPKPKPEPKSEPTVQTTRMPRPTTSNEQFTYDDFGFLSCTTRPSIPGIDVSYYQGDIDWAQVKAAGVEFVFVRLGSRNSQDGTLTEDRNAKENLAGAKAAGLKIGAYFFSQAVNPEEAKEEAALAVEVLGNTKLDLPLAYDWEIYKADGRTKTVTQEILLSCIKTFCTAVESAGYKSMVYFNLELSKTLLDPEQIAQYPFWFAQYADFPELPYNMAFWQYSDSGTVPGIEGEVDLNLWFDA
jgi:GH25 family lysozyme M1 (1,4-beta-N-acetylmuramidase)